MIISTNGATEGGVVYEAVFFSRENTARIDDDRHSFWNGAGASALRLMYTNFQASNDGLGRARTGTNVVNDLFGQPIPGDNSRMTLFDIVNAVEVGLDYATGPLQAGGRYLAVVTGRTGQTGALAPRLLVVQDRFAPSALDARLRLVNAVPNAPAEGVDFGYFDVAGDGNSKGSSFTPVVTGVKYGDTAGADTGVAFQAPITTGTTPLSYYGLRASSGTPLSYALGNAMERPHFIVLLGDWETKYLQFLGFNVRENSWSGVTPFDVFVE